MNETLFEQSIAPLSREEYFRLSLDDRQAHWARYLALVDTKEVASAIYSHTFLRSTGPQMRCAHAGCESLAEEDHWYCIEHRMIDDALTNVATYEAMRYGYDASQQQNGVIDRIVWSALVLLAAVGAVYLLIVLWGLVHGLSASLALGGGR